jgi:uncharacterized BrkB/YihY/UPF0761 family membrane protein
MEFVYLFGIFLILLLVVITSPIWIAIIAYNIFSKRFDKKLKVWTLTLMGFILGIILIVLFFALLSLIPEFHLGFN